MAPGDRRPARFTVELARSGVGDAYVPVANAVDATASRLNILQFQTIRRYLSLSSRGAVAPSWCWQYGLIHDLAVRSAQCRWCC